MGVERAYPMRAPGWRGAIDEHDRANRHQIVRPDKIHGLEGDPGAAVGRWMRSDGVVAVQGDAIAMEVLRAVHASQPSVTPTVDVPVDGVATRRRVGRRCVAGRVLIRLLGPRGGMEDPLQLSVEHGVEELSSLVDLDDPARKRPSI